MTEHAAAQTPPFEAYSGDGKTVFVSYSHADAGAVYPELSRLRESGFNIWFDEGISPGHNWPEELAHAIEHCAVFLLFVSGRSVSSDNCVRETNFALSRGKSVVAVHLEETQLPSGLELSLGDTQAIFEHQLSADVYAHKLEVALQEFTGVQTPAAADAPEAPEPAVASTIATTPAAGWLTARWAFAVIVAAGLGAMIWFTSNETGQSPETESADLTELITAGELFAAYQVLRERPEAETTLSDQLLSQVQLSATLLSEPTGARVAVRPLPGEDIDWLELGITPLADIALPLGDYQYRFVLDGYRPRVVFRQNPGFLLGNQFTDEARPVELITDSEPDLEPIPATPLTIGAMSNYIIEEAALVPAFTASRFEVTNREYKEFVDIGGYQDESYWPELTEATLAEGLDVKAGLARFVDGTGRPGPSTWELGTFAPRTAEHPVAGISWYEAMAYARFREAALPTLHHWSALAFPVRASNIGPLSNLNGSGTKPVGAQGIVGINGTQDTYGNVREWIFNATEGASDENPQALRWILGGGWSDPDYMANQTFALPPMNRSELNGVRLVYHTEPYPDAFHNPRPTGEFDYRGREPVSDEAFAVMTEGFIDRGPRELDPQVIYQRDEGDWIRERVSITSDVPGERLDLLVFLPKTPPAPHQAVIYFPPIDMFQFAQDFDALDIRQHYIPIDFVPRSGRAFVWPMFQGSGSRYFGLMEMEAHQRAALQTDLREHWYADAKRTIDYLETREDINADALAYLGFSYGASQMLPVLAFEQRFKAAVLVAGGLGQLLVDQMQEGADSVNFLPRITLPLVMLSGENDFVFPLETAQRPLFDGLGTPNEQKRHVLYQGSHYRIPRTELIRDAADWLDRYLGPVRP